MSTPLKILLAEDDPAIAQMYVTKFTHEGFNITHLPDGTGCQQKAKELKPDMIMLDVEMPNTNGLAALNELKADQDTKDIPVVMLTNLNADASVKLAIETGAEAYIIKSQEEPTDVVNIIRGLISDHQKRSKK